MYGTVEQDDITFAVMDEKGLNSYASMNMIYIISPNLNQNSR
jgi:hypothetical protein